MEPEQLSIFWTWEPQMPCLLEVRFGVQTAGGKEWSLLCAEAGTVRSEAPVPGLLGVGWASALMLWEQSSWLDFPRNLTEGSCSL